MTGMRALSAVSYDCIALVLSLLSAYLLLSKPRRKEETRRVAILR